MYRADKKGRKTWHSFKLEEVYSKCEASRVCTSLLHTQEAALRVRVVGVSEAGRFLEAKGKFTQALCCENLTSEVWLH